MLIELVIDLDSVLFSFPSKNLEEGEKRRFYCMEAACPHLGAPLENATLEDQTDEEDEMEDLVIVWYVRVRAVPSVQRLTSLISTVRESEQKGW